MRVVVISKSLYRLSDTRWIRTREPHCHAALAPVVGPKHGAEADLFVEVAATSLVVAAAIGSDGRW